MSEPVQVRYESRSTRETLVEIVVFAGLMLAYSYFFLSQTSRNGVGWEMLSSAGEAILGQIGWGLGTYVPIMLGFYAVVASGRLPGNEPLGERTHRHMGIAAEALAGSTVPLFVLVLIHCTAAPEKAGVMLVITPVMGSSCSDDSPEFPFATR